MMRHHQAATREASRALGRAALAAVVVLGPACAAADGASPGQRPVCVLDSIAWDVPVRVPLPGGLREVSGLAATRAGRLLAHDDERGVISILDASSGEEEGRFSLGPRLPRDDFEGIAVLGDRVFLSSSAGRLYETRVGGDGQTVPFRVRDTGLGSRCELEGLAADPATGSLLLSCKEPRASELRGQTIVFSWSPDRAEPAEVLFRAPQLALRTANGNTFRPSAVERLPGGGLLVLSGADRAIAHVVPPDVVRCRRRLDPRHGQAEGLALLPGGGLAIADEGDPPRLTIYSYRVR